MSEWETREKPGFLGKKKDATFAKWNRDFGEGNWRIVWELANGDIFNFDDIFWKIYVPGYVQFFLAHMDEAVEIANKYSYTIDKEMVTKEQAFDPYFLYEKPGHNNQVHNVAANVGLVWFLGLPFRGNVPLQIREGKKNTPKETWPAGWMYSPGRIPAVRKELIPKSEINEEEVWWGKGSIEEQYQVSKVMQVRIQL